MKNLLKKKLSSVLVIIFTLCVMFYNSPKVFAESSDFQIDEYGVLTKYVGKGGNVVIPDGVKEIGEKAFYSLSSITSVTIPNSVMKIRDYAFDQCNGITSITIPEGVVYIGSRAFYLCSKLISIKLPDSLKSIDDFAFQGCKALIGITIPKGVTYMGASQFSQCESLENINVDSNNLSYSSENGVLFTKDKVKLLEYPIGNKRAVYTMPNTVKVIGSAAFDGAEYLTNVDMSINLEYIGGYSFYLCRNLTNITIKNGVIGIGNGAFSYCDSLTSVNIPSSVVEIGEYAFRGCFDLTEINVDLASKYFSSENGVLFNKEKTQLIYYPTGSKITSYNIPDSVKDIKDSAFLSAKELTNVTIPEGVTVIKERTFEFCSGLTNVTIPNTVTDIQQYAFSGCRSLRKLSIPSSVASIGDSAFSVCEKLVNVNIAGVSTKIGSYAFSFTGEGLIIYGKPNSNSQRYAQAMGIQFKVGDVNADFRVDLIDIDRAGRAYNAAAGDNLFDEDLDYNNDKVIDIFDIVMISKEIVQ